MSYDDDDGFFLLEDVSLVVKLCRVHRCKLLERMLWQILGEGPAVRGRSALSDVSFDISPSPLYIPPHCR